MAETQVRESDATKCIFASSCVEDVCLDDDGPCDSACKAVDLTCSAAEVALV